MNARYKMTSYHGGKQRIGKRIAQKMVDISSEMYHDRKIANIKGYCEPFCGMLGVYRYVPAFFEEEGFENLRYLAGDTNGSVIAMWKKATSEARKGKVWEAPAPVSEKEYNRMKKDTRDTADKGFVGHQYSFGGQYFHGYGPKYGKTLSAYDSAAKRVNDIADELNDVKFFKGHYEQFSDLKQFVIYCDPPYVNTECCYGRESAFNNDDFWHWVQDMAKHNIVFVSNYNAPKGTEVVFTSEHSLTGFKSAKKRRRAERLYLVKPSCSKGRSRRR